MFNPQWARRSCQDCQTYVYNQDGTQTKRAGLPVLRGPKDPPPCYKCPKIPDGDPPIPSYAVELSVKNRKAYDHWQESRAVGFNQEERNDSIVRRNASIIQSVYDSWNRQPQQELMTAMTLMTTGK